MRSERESGRGTVVEIGVASAYSGRSERLSDEEYIVSRISVGLSGCFTGGARYGFVAGRKARGRQQGGWRKGLKQDKT